MNFLEVVLGRFIEHNARAISVLPCEQIRKHGFSTVQNFGACTFCLPDSSGSCVARRIVSKYTEEEDWKNENAWDFPVWRENSEGGGDVSDFFQIVKAADSKQHIQSCCLLNHAMPELQGMRTRESVV